MYAFVVAYNKTVILHEFILVSEVVGEDVELIWLVNWNEHNLDFTSQSLTKYNLVQNWDHVNWVVWGTKTITALDVTKN